MNAVDKLNEFEDVIGWIKVWVNNINISPIDDEGIDTLNDIYHLCDIFAKALSGEMSWETAVQKKKELVYL